MPIVDDNGNGNGKAKSDISLTSPSEGSSTTTSSHKTPPPLAGHASARSSGNGTRNGNGNGTGHGNGYSNGNASYAYPSPRSQPKSPLSKVSLISSSSSSSSSKSTATATPLDSVRSQVHTAPPATRDPSLRTLMDVQRQVAAETAIRGVSKAISVDGVKIGVVLTLGKHEEEAFLHEVASDIMHKLILNGDYLFAVTTTSNAAPLLSNGLGVSGSAQRQSNYLVILGSEEELVQRAVLLASSKFLDRVESVHNSGKTWTAYIRDRGTMTYDEACLWDVVKKAARKPIDPMVPPPGSRGIDEILGIARTKLQRVTPVQAYEELHDPHSPHPVFLVDIRPFAQRQTFGGIHGSLVIERNVLEWRFDPRCEARLPIANAYDLRVIVFCQEGFTSSLAAVALQELGLANATDVVGGYQAWREAGLPGEVHVPVAAGVGASDPSG